MKSFRQFYLLFQKGASMRPQLSWTHIRILLLIKDDNKRNYYINLCLIKKLSKRELRKEDKGQIEFYMKLVDEEIKELRNNKTIGILITKEHDKFIANFVGH